MVPVIGPVGRIGMATGTNLDEETSICIRCEKPTEKKNVPLSAISPTLTCGATSDPNECVLPNNFVGAGTF